MKRALVVGSSGQDGTLLGELLTRRGTAWVGHDIEALVGHGIDVAALPRAVDLLDRAGVARLVDHVQPDELYYLAAHHHSSEDTPDLIDELRKSLDVNVAGLAHALDAVRAHAPRCRVFYAGSSHMFGHPTVPVQDESTPFAPRSPYGIAKVAGAHTIAVYREQHGIHASVGILYNHESPLRGPRFVVQRIARGAKLAARDRANKLYLGSLSAKVDWGWAADYVEAMTRIVGAAQPGDYVLATGQAHTVGELAEIAYRHVGLDFREHVQEKSGLAASQPTLIGDASKAREKLGWRPTMDFEGMVRAIVSAAE